MIPPENQHLFIQTLAHVFSCEFCEISNNTFFTQHIRTTDSGFTNQAEKVAIFDEENRTGNTSWTILAFQLNGLNEREATIFLLNLILDIPFEIVF